MSGEFIDTNVIVYAHDTSAGDKGRRAGELITRLGRSRSGLLSVQVLMELVATLNRKVRKPVPLSAVVEIVHDLTTWRVHEPSAKDVIAAVRIAQRYTISTWDAMIVHAAASLGAEVLWTEDLNHGQIYEGVPVRNPFRED
ncbi:MAG: PIN domain-containing protein [Thermoanaerobaculales bacterium]|nr:PIN domain-containing protein [Thermoanaerobaculales bacterium]